jgi:hypothetical protein
MHHRAVLRPRRVSKTGIFRQTWKGDREFMNDSDTPGEGRHDERLKSSGGAVKSNATVGGRRQAVQKLASSAGAPAALTEDPFEHLSPGERFARAIDRRDALVRKLGQADKKS